jgi:hypothetical protein
MAIAIYHIWDVDKMADCSNSDSKALLELSQQISISGQTRIIVLVPYLCHLQVPSDLMH